MKQYHMWAVMVQYCRYINAVCWCLPWDFDPIKFSGLDKTLVVDIQEKLEYILVLFIFTGIQHSVRVSFCPCEKKETTLIRLGLFYNFDICFMLNFLKILLP